MTDRTKEALKAGLKRATTPPEKKAILMRYAALKFELQDWHGLADVCCDLRELEARFPNLKNAHQPG